MKLNSTFSIQNGPKIYFSIGVVWLFHISGIVGITIGFESWFVPKTPLNLLVCLVLLVWQYPIKTLKTALLTLVFFSCGMLIEWIGVHHDFLFGAYHYGNNLGAKIDGVPLLIGVNWAVLTLITGTIASKLTNSFPVRVITGAFLMVFLDFFLEVSAPVFDFWHWEAGAAPIRNFITWFLASCLLHAVLQLYKVIGNDQISIHLYLAQLAFFVYFYGIHHL
ncbi:carotenoid biosynthesis protein [Fulvivirga sp. M361]|uniref:carotenoid biosynthesis protein n=1 Tax=Fulvivirga sp. M361 TaxID=2594266 RepID=UPI00117A7068|nr:carotenoid biosynthesis protein [Fulvivirga sp. M361]TRX57544.1 carotenoid biosynthesis protein [Fulvivirga sp. M361]